MTQVDLERFLKIALLEGSRLYVEKLMSKEHKIVALLEEDLNNWLRDSPVADSIFKEYEELTKI